MQSTTHIAIRLSQLATGTPVSLHLIGGQTVEGKLNVYHCDPDQSGDPTAEIQVTEDGAAPKLWIVRTDTIAAFGRPAA